MRFLQINTTVNSGSTGRFAEEIGRILIANGHDSHIAFGRGNRPSASELIRVGNRWDIGWHGIKTRFFDRHGFGSKSATKELVESIKILQPDLVHLHNIHGYYLNVEVLFSYLKSAKLPVVWTLYDCWPFTGHCSYFDIVKCIKWHKECFNCPNKRAYPRSWWLDNSKENYLQKKRLFTGLDNMVLVVPSQWLKSHLDSSFLNKYPVKVIHHGIDTSVFRMINSEIIRDKYGIGDRKFILGVASVWDRRKGLDDFIELNRLIDRDTVILLVGLNAAQLKKLPEGMIGIARTENIDELVAFYSAAYVFVNPTRADNFPTTNIEALSCGTPVITYDTGGSPEAIDDYTGVVVARGDVEGLWSAAQEIFKYPKKYYSSICRNRALEMFNNQEIYAEYLDLYDVLLKVQNG